MTTETQIPAVVLVVAIVVGVVGVVAVVALIVWRSRPAPRVTRVHAEGAKGPVRVDASESRKLDVDADTDVHC